MFDKLNLFFDTVKTITWWQRIFSWKNVRTLSYDAYEEFKSLMVILNTRSADLEETKNSLGLLKNDCSHLQQDLTEAKDNLKQLQEKYNTQTTALQDLRSEYASQKQNLENTHAGFNQQKEKIAVLEERIQHLEEENRKFEKSNNQFLQIEEDRKQKYESDIANLNKIRQQIQDDRKSEIEQRQNEEIEKLNAMKETWAKHQSSVQDTIKMICQKHTIEYIENVPFKGNPDNTIKLCDEFIIFDAKSPGSDDLQNFRNYLKNQTESVKKYAKLEDVKKDIFLVIPSNTVSVVDKFCYNLADYNVYVVTHDSLEPIILSLKKIEDYEFLEQLSPEDKENLCRIVGKFAHTAKRRIQIDQYFAGEYFEILTKCETAIPRDMLGKIIEFEKAEKLNPPIEKRVKQIPLGDLHADSQRIEREANAKGIALPHATQEGIKKLPLYDDEQTTP